MIEARLGSGPHEAKAIYRFLLEKIIVDRNGKRKLSRAEEKWQHIDWKRVWENHQKIQLVTPVVKERAWLIKHDMLPGLRARAFRHRIAAGVGDKLCHQKK